MDARTVTVRATYRLQFHAGFTFRDATALVPYLARLGISHVYASPYLAARAGSTHGYDIVDHARINPEIGTRAELEAFVAALRAHGMGHILDFVPNHMAVGGADNPWWLDVLTWGPDSHYADYFDIDWEPLRSEMRCKVLLPFLGTQYGEALDAGELRWEYAHGEISLRYFEHRFPLAPASYALALEDAIPASLASFAALFAALDGIADRHERRASGASLQRLVAETEDAGARAWIARLDEARTTPEGKALLDRVVDAQHWRPASWRVAAEEINYRRFFDINALGALRMEHAGCFADVHALVFSLIEAKLLDGLRLDHVDGLFDPIGHCELLRSRADLLGQPLYLVVEKIMAAGGTLRERWHVDGTTGYEFANAVTGLFVDGRAERAFDRLYGRFTGDHTPFAQVAYDAKRFMLTRALSSELRVLGLRLDRIARHDPHTRDFTLGTLTRALIEIIAAFPVYRTYVTAEGVHPADAAIIDHAIAEARRRDPATEPSVYAFVRRVLLAEQPEFVEFAMRFQQLTAPIAAKGVEDTAFYRSVRLVALNEVGGDPGRFGTTAAEFHAENAARAALWPHGMLATATHDAKRGEDVRARLAVLSEMPQEWGRAISRWARRTRRARGPIDPRDEYLLYQTVVGAWPVELLEGAPPPGAVEAFVERVIAYAHKAAREAKLHTSWTNPDAGYEHALAQAARGLLDPTGTLFEEVRAFARSLAAAALTNTLAQTVLRATSPGVPDTYQGAELWDLTLVDPDNRRPVDFAARAAALAALDARLESGTTRAELAAGLLENWADGRLKLYVLATLLRARPDFAAAGYEALAAEGEWAEHAVAFARGSTLIAVPRLSRAIAGERPPLGAAWGATEVVLPRPSDRYRDLLTGSTVTPTAAGRLRLADAFGTLPLAVLTPD